MNTRHQRGHLRCTRRKNGPSVWEFLWRENDANGKRVRRTVVIGNVDQYPTQDLALAAVNRLRVSINEACNRQRQRSVLIGDLMDHYVQTELCDRAEWYSEATKVIYAEFLQTWIRPHWATINIRDIRTIAVENWLRQLHRKDGNPLANTTKAKIRNLMSVLFNHAIRYEWLEQGKNPITLVDEVFLKINGQVHYLWRAVDQDGDVLDILVQSRRDKKAAKKFFSKLLKGLRYVPRTIVTDKLRSYSAARADLMPSVEHIHEKHQNNRAENSHQPTRLRERVMRRFKSAGHAQRFLSAFGIFTSHFRVGRHLYRASAYRAVMKSRFAEWEQAIASR